MFTIKNLPHWLAVAAALIVSACGASNARAEHPIAPDATEAAGVEELAEPAAHFDTICSIARADLNEAVSGAIADGWEIVNCTMYETQAIENTDSVLGHCCYLSR